MLRRFRPDLTRLFWILVVVVIVASQRAWADPFACHPSPSLFASHSLFAGSLAEPVLEGAAKMVRREFGSLPILPSGAHLLASGTELNVVVDTVCLTDEARGPKTLSWLKNLRTKINVNPKSPLRSYHYPLERHWRFNELQEVFEAEACVRIVSPERRFYLHRVPRDPLAKQQSHLDRLGFNRSITAFFLPLMLRRKTVSIAVIDTGVDFAHPDLKLNRWINKREIAANGVDDDRNGYVDDVNGFNFASMKGAAGPEGEWDENRHGSHVAGLAAARIDNQIGVSGVHGVAKLMSLNVFGLNAYTRSSVLENAIRFAADEGADIINMSLGGREYSRSMRSVLGYAINKGSFIVAASGNDAIELCDDPNSFDFISPAVYGRSLEGMIVTASIDAASGQISTFSNFSSRLVEIAAPGALTSQGGRLTGLLSTVPKNSYGYLAGTSMAAPVVSGVAALVVAWLKAYRYDVSPQRIEGILKSASPHESRLAPFVENGRVLSLTDVTSYLKKQYPPRVPH